MSPNSFQDILPPERRSIRNIRATHARERRVRSAQDSSQPPPPPPVRTSRSRYPSRRRWPLLLLLLVILMGSIAGFSLVFAGSKIVVIPKQKDVVVEGTFQAQKDATAGGVLSYQIMTYSKSASKTVEASGEEDAQVRAMGTIIVFNDFSTAEQKLIKNTRFEAENGKIYRIADSITVPGQSTKDGKTTRNEEHVIWKRWVIIKTT